MSTGAVHFRAKHLLVDVVAQFEPADQVSRKLLWETRYIQSSKTEADPLWIQI